MSLTDPAGLIAVIDQQAFQKYWQEVNSETHNKVQYVEPPLGEGTSPSNLEKNDLTEAAETSPSDGSVSSSLVSKIIILEDFIDTDAVSYFRCLFFIVPVLLAFISREFTYLAIACTRDGTHDSKDRRGIG